MPERLGGFTTMHYINPFYLTFTFTWIVRQIVLLG